MNFVKEAFDLIAQAVVWLVVVTAMFVTFAGTLLAVNWFLDWLTT